ncbi:MAG TPA: hypothetical protein VG206_19555 [Terriglobia bacterium]|nr:hypothetical protein [Terriglobia bacterium]
MLVIRAGFPIPGGGGVQPVNNLLVKVTSQTANSWMFTTDPRHHFFDGTIAFMASDAGNGNVNFVVTANANFSGLFSRVFGRIIKWGENSTWNNLLNNVQDYCSGLGSQ